MSESGEANRKIPSEAELEEAREMNGQFDKVIYAEVQIETQKLAQVMVLIEDAISHEVLNGSDRIGALIEDLPSSDGSKKIIDHVPRESRFYKNYSKVTFFVDLLKHFRDQEVFSNGDPLKRVYKKLFERSDENKEILVRCQ
jgi:hypothetical protein